MESIKKIKEAEVYAKLLSYGYFPNKLEQILSSQQFGEYIVDKKVIPSYPHNEKFDFVTYKGTNNNNTKRFFSIPHPIPYINLCHAIKTDWKEIKKRFLEIPCYESISFVTVKKDNHNHRLISMDNYDKYPEEEKAVIKNLLSSRYIVHTDISNFFPSIYTHSVPWAYVGKALSKSEDDGKKWFNKLDICLRTCQNKETIGLPIGPDTSNLVGELILSRIDKQLVSKGYKFIRYIDDYKCYCEDRTEAEEFIDNLSTLLEDYRLKINSKKTYIKELPETLNEPWVIDLRNYDFDKDIDNHIIVNKKNVKKSLDFIDLSIKLLDSYPDKSTIKYATKVIWKAKYQDYYSYHLILNRLAGLCLLYPYFIDCLEEMFKKGFTFSNLKTEHCKNILEIITSTLDAHRNYNCPEVLTYCLYILIKYRLKLRKWKKLEETFLKKNDCLLTLFTYIYAKVNGYNVSRYKAVFNKKKNEDNQWLFIYEFARKERINLSSAMNCRIRGPFFEKLRMKNISFLDKDIKNIL